MSLIPQSSSTVCDGSLVWGASQVSYLRYKFRLNLFVLSQPHIEVIYIKQTIHLFCCNGSKAMNSQ